jgi:hypothetical protein
MLTFREFYQICEGKKPFTPPHAVPGTFQTHRDPQTGEVTHSSYTLQPYEGPLGKPKKKEIDKLVVKRSGRKPVMKELERSQKEELKRRKKEAKKRIAEDIEQRRVAARQQRSDQIATLRRNVANYQSAQQNQRKNAFEREQLKNEIKKELTNEQHPTMQQNEYNKQVARQSARWKGMQIRQAHGEMEHEAGAEIAAKRARMKSIMSR